MACSRLGLDCERNGRQKRSADCLRTSTNHERKASEFIYEEVERWTQLPPDWDLGEVPGIGEIHSFVAANDRRGGLELKPLPQAIRSGVMP